MNKFGKSTIAIILPIIFITLIITAYVSRRIYSFEGNKIIALKIADDVIYAEVVSDQAKMEKGLSGRSFLCSSCGMLFEFSEKGRHSFWMKDMKISLDMIWLFDNRVVHIEKNIDPTLKDSLNPIEKADSVLELNAGKVDELGISSGSEITH